jgi:uncharacterized RDD family membrane protein YckC
MSLAAEGVGPLRRLGAIVYDTLLVSALLMVVTAVFLLFTREPIAAASGWVLYFYRTTLLCVALGFFVYCWTAKGQTLGMQAWRIRVARLDARLPTPRDALLRLFAASIFWLPALIVIAVALQPGASKNLVTIGYWLFALVPLNYLSAWLDTQRRSWHDRLLQTRVVRV